MKRSLATVTLLAAIGGGFVSLPALAQDSPVVVTGAAAKLRPYRINPGDDLDISVWGEDKLSRSVRVLPDGTFSFPLAGQIDAANKLPQDIERAITAGLKAQFRENVPQVTVSVKSATGLQFTVTGKVKGPGAFTPGRYVNVLEALTLAGGPDTFANISDVTILRKTGGRLTAIKVRLNEVMKGNLSERDLAGLEVLESGDTVIVP